jgi:hypothetical protein
VYCIDGRGRKWLEPAGLVPALQAASVGTANMTVNRIATTGKVFNDSVLFPKLIRTRLGGQTQQRHVRVLMCLFMCCVVCHLKHTPQNQRRQLMCVPPCWTTAGLLQQLAGSGFLNQIMWRKDT